LFNAASLSQPDMVPATVTPCVASIYQLDGLVRRASSLQLTADARQAPAATEETHA
jgi:NADH-quinone oxidoreductase subunit G